MSACALLGLALLLSAPPAVAAGASCSGGECFLSGEESLLLQLGAAASGPVPHGSQVASSKGASEFAGEKAARLPHARADALGSSPYHRQPMLNFDDVQYSIEMEIGGQKVQAVADTGSFDLVVFSKACGLACGTAALYNSQLSKTYEEGEWVMQQSYGSGAVMSVDATDLVKVGPLVSPNQFFWDGFDADMPLLQDASFHAIAGIGPPGETQKEAADQAKDSEEAVISMEKLGLPVPPELTQQLADDKKFLAYLTPKKSMLENLGVSVFSVCLKKEVGEPGYLTWNDPAPKTHPSLFTPIKVVGKSTWSVQLQNVRVGGISLGCADSSCAALLDTGTSLLVAPTSVFDSMQAALDLLQPDCSNLDELPDLHFELGGVKLSLPPDSYLGTVTGQLPDDMKKLYNYLPKPKLECQLLLMTENAATNFGPLWIMGMPFFRKYYTAFDLGGAPQKPGGAPQKSMLLAEADSGCHPSAATSLRNKQRLRRVDLSKVRVPRWVVDPAARGGSAGTDMQL